MRAFRIIVSFALGFTSKTLLETVAASEEEIS